MNLPPCPAHPFGDDPTRPPPSAQLTAEEIWTVRVWMAFRGLYPDRIGDLELIDLLVRAEKLAKTDYAPGSVPSSKLAAAIITLMRD